MGLGRHKQARSRAAYLAHMYASCRNPMPAALVKLRPGHQRWDLLTSVRNSVPHFKVVVGDSPLPKVPLGTEAVLNC